MNRCFVAANASKQKLGNAMGDRFEFSLSRKETSTFFLPLSLRPFPSFSISSPPPCFSPSPYLSFPRACPVAFLFRGQILPLTFYDSANRLDATRQSHAKRCYWPRICRNNCYDYRAEISFMNLDFFYVSVRISVGKEFSIGSGTGFTGGEL